MQNSDNTWGGKAIGKKPEPLLDPERLERRIEELERELAKARRASAEARANFESVTAEHDLLSGAFESLSDGVALFDPDDRLIFCNTKFKEQNPELAPSIRLGMTFEDMLRDNIKHGRILDAKGREEAFICERMRQHRSPGKPTLSARKDGRWLLLREERTPDGCTFLVNTDLTELKRSEENFRNLVEGSIQGVYILSPDRELLFANQAFAEIYGYDSPAAILALGTTRTLSAPYERDRLEEYRLARLRGENVPTQYEYDGVRKDGTIIRLQVIARKTAWQGRGAVQVTVVDVTERVRAEKKAAESVTQLRSLVDASPLHITLKDREGKFLLVNQAFADYFDTTISGAVGKTSFDYMSNDDAGAVTALDRKMLEAGKVIEEEYETTRRDGSPHYRHRTKFPVRDATGAVVGIGTFGADISEQRNLENQLRQSQKMEVIGQLTGGVAHDFNNLLGVIIGNLDIAAETIGEENPIRPLLDAATKAALSGANLNRQLLAFSRKQTLSPKVIDLNEHVSAMLDMLRRTLGATIEIEVKRSHGPWTVEADPAQVESALLNLALNARDGMPDGGKLTIKTMKVGLDEDYVSAHPYVTSGEYVLLAVTDTGTGISPENLAHVFEPFFTTKDVGEGSGLGLSMVFGFTKQSGGHVEIESEEGQGTTVKLYLPHLQRAAEAAREETEDFPNARGETILVVEDNPEMLTLATNLLRSLDYEVLAAKDGVSALAAMGGASAIDLLLTDVVMPGGMSGPALAEEVATRRPDIKMLYMSGYAPNAMEHLGPLDNDAPLLRKPFRKPELARMVRAVLDT